jgi:hypothetical protein
MRINIMIRKKDLGGKIDFEYLTPQNARKQIEKFVRNEEIIDSLI